MKQVNGLPLLPGPLYAPDGTKVEDWWEMAEWFRKYEGPLWLAGTEKIEAAGECPVPGSAAQRLRAQASGYRGAYEAIRRIAENQVVEGVLGHDE